MPLEDKGENSIEDSDENSKEEVFEEVKREVKNYSFQINHWNKGIYQDIKKLLH